MLLMASEVILRFTLNKPTMWIFETSLMLGVCIYVLAWSYVQRHRGHVRVELIYMLLKTRGRALLDVIGHLIFLFPLFIIFTYVSGQAALESWAINERMIYSRWYPPFAPIRTVIVIASFLLLVQSFAVFVRDVHLLIRGKAYD